MNKPEWMSVNPFAGFDKGSKETAKAILEYLIVIARKSMLLSTDRDGVELANFIVVLRSMLKQLEEK
jgi:hypothetical protein